jgi:hypothetical protein
MARRWLLVLLLFITGVSSLVALSPAPAKAVSAAYCNQANASSSSFLGFPTWYKYLNPRIENGGCKLDTAFPEVIPRIAFALFEILLRVAGVAAVMFIVYGGFQYLTSTGEPDKAKNARTTIINAVIGLLIVIFSTVIVNVVANNITA